MRTVTLPLFTPLWPVRPLPSSPGNLQLQGRLLLQGEESLCPLHPRGGLKDHGRPPDLQVPDPGDTRKQRVTAACTRRKTHTQTHTKGRHTHVHTHLSTPTLTPTAFACRMETKEPTNGMFSRRNILLSSATPRYATLRHATSRYASPRLATPRYATTPHHAFDTMSGLPSYGGVGISSKNYFLFFLIGWSS